MKRSIPNYRLYQDHDPDSDLSCEPVHVDDVTVSMRQHNWMVSPHRHDDLYQLVFYRNGRGKLELEELEYAFNAPIFLLIPPTSIHSFDISRDLEGEVISVADSFLKNLIAPSPLAIDILNHPLLLNGPEHEEFLQQVNAIFEQIKTEYNERQLARNLTLQSLLGMLIGKILRYQDHAQQREQSWGVDNPAPWYFRQFQNQIGQHLSEKLSITEYAARLRISATHLNRVCREVAGKSALDVVHDRIIQEAKRSFAYTVMPVAEVAYQLGFNDPSYFSRFFKDKTGLSPKSYQARVREEI
jgi:AraC family transcriptional regulator, transcriptional activator of pobA